MQQAELLAQTMDHSASKEPENLESLCSFAYESMNNFFNWGNDKFMLG
jgi:hypothetical protein